MAASVPLFFIHYSSRTMTDFLFHATPRSTVIDLGDGLIMRWSVKDDSDNIATLVGDAFRRRLLCGKNAVMTENDYALVEDTRHEPGKNPIAACVALHRVRAFYGCVDLIFGKPELIATQPAYRNRGLVRRLLLEMIHSESEARRDDLQFIPGIPHFYSQFGYEYGLTSFPTGKIPNVQAIPTLEKGKTEPFTLRRAIVGDIPYLVSSSTKENIHPFTQVGLQHGAEYWHWTIRDAPSMTKTIDDCNRDTRIVINVATGEVIGFTVTSHESELVLELFWLKENVSLEEPLYSVLRQLAVHHTHRLQQKEAQKTNMEVTNASSAKSFHFVLQLHPCHPAIALLHSILAPQEDEPGYRMYTRIYDYPRFIRTVAPELESRLAQSSMAGITGRLRLDFYRKVEGNRAFGLEIIFENGRISDVQDWVNPGPEGTVTEYLTWKAANNIPVVYSAAFAPLTFNTLLMGERSLRELKWAYGETTVKNAATESLLNALFPRVSQHIDLPFWL